MKSLKERWDEKRVSQNSRRNILKLLKKGRTVTNDTSPFGTTVDGYVDLRGLDLNSAILKNVKISNVDFSYSNFQSAWIENCRFENSLMKKIDFSNITEKSNSFNSVLFSESRFKKSYLGYDGSKFNSCELTKVNFSGTSFIRPEFDNCVFSNSKLNGIDFNGSSFNECIFSGELKNVWFRGGFPSDFYIKEFGQPRKNEMINVSFKDANLYDVHFSNGCDLSSVKLPANNNYCINKSWNDSLNELKLKSKEWSSVEQRKVELYVNPHLVHSKYQDYYIINKAETLKEFGEELGEKVLDFLC